jgi:ABC-2 type transport system permease protein
MKQLLTVLKFEFLNFLKNKVFIVLTLVVAVVIAIITFFPRFSSMTNISFGDKEKEKQSLLIIDNSQLDGTGELLKTALTEYDATVEKGKNLDEAKTVIKNGDYDAAILLTSPTEYSYIVNNLGLYDTTAYLIDEILISNYKTLYLANAGFTEEQIVEFSSIAINGTSIVVGEDHTQSFFHAYLLMMVLYMAVLVYGQLVAQSVATEKSSRAMELLITSANPKSLIFGKVLGTGLAGLSQITCLLGWGLICLMLNKKYFVGNEIFEMFSGISTSLVVYTIIFFVLGFLLYAFLMGSLGSMASKLEDVGTLTMPAMFTFVISFVASITFLSAGSVDSTIMKALSFIPFTSPMAMFARICMGTATTIEALISIVILIVSIIVIGYFAVAVYRIGILMYGKPPKFNEIIRALKKK